VTATQAIGKSFSSGAIQIFGTVVAGLLVLVWIFVFFMMIRAFFLKRLLWPGEIYGSKVSAKWRAPIVPGVTNHPEKANYGNGTAV
jgi:hypothetical protein